MQKYKKGFTLIEVLIVITVMGIILALSVGTLKVIKNSYSSLTYFAYNNIKDIVTEVVSGRMPMETGSETTIYCLSNSKGIVNILTPDSPSDPYSRFADSDSKFPKEGLTLCNVAEFQKINPAPASYSKYNTAGSYLTFCEALLEKVNTQGVTHCESLYNASGTSDLAVGKNPIDYNTAVPTFIGTNGQRYFLSGRTYASDISSDFGYRVMAVDLNGTRGPNTATNDEKGEGPVPDVVTFIIFDNGVVLPTGVAATNTTRNGKEYFYLTAKINAKRDDGNSLYISSGNVYSFQGAFCEVTDERPLAKYCSEKSPPQSVCPPSGSGQIGEETITSCNIELIRPAFRYNL